MSHHADTQGTNATTSVRRTFAELGPPHETSRSTEVRARICGTQHLVEVNITGRRFSACEGRRCLFVTQAEGLVRHAFVLLHNDEGGVIAAANRVLTIFGLELVGPIRTALDDLRGKFGNLAVTAIDQFHRQLLQR